MTFYSGDFFDPYTKNVRFGVPKNLFDLLNSNGNIENYIKTPFAKPVY